MTAKKVRWNKWQAGDPKPNVPAGTLLCVRLASQLNDDTAALSAEQWNWGGGSPITGWRRAEPAVRKKKPAPAQAELPITEVAGQQPAPKYVLDANTVFSSIRTNGYRVLQARHNGANYALFMYTISSMGCCGMRELRGQALADNAGELAYSLRGMSGVKPLSLDTVPSWHPLAVQNAVTYFTEDAVEGSGGCLAVFSSNEHNDSMKVRQLYELLLADPLKRCVPLPAFRNSVHNSLLYPMFLYATGNLPDSYKGETRMNWGPGRVQISSPRLSKTGAPEYVSDSLKAT